MAMNFKQAENNQTNKENESWRALAFTNISFPTLNRDGEVVYRKKGVIKWLASDPLDAELVEKMSDLSKADQERVLKVIVSKLRFDFIIPGDKTEEAYDLDIDDILKE